MIKYAIIGCGDIGRRVATKLIQQGVSAAAILATVESEGSAAIARALGIQVGQANFDTTIKLPEAMHRAKWCYLVPPQKSGTMDLRSERFLQAALKLGLQPEAVALISTTGVYGDAIGEWVDESTPPKPNTERAKRRLDMEQEWQTWAMRKQVPLRILRVPGIYANSRIPRARLRQGIPVVSEDECGFTNRVHADDLASAVIAAMHYSGDERIFNVTDGTPSTITAYLQAAAAEIDLPPLPEISMEEAQRTLSPAMLSYLTESRKIGNDRLVNELGVVPRYPDLKQGLKI